MTMSDEPATPPRTHLRDGKDCEAFVMLQPDGTGTVHVIRIGQPSLTVFGCVVREARRNEKSTEEM